MIRDVPPWVYFVRRIDGEGPVKIGCSQSPEGRLRSLMVWAPYPLEIAARMAGDESLEWRFHAQFADLHSHREWFFPTPELNGVIAAVAAGSFDIATLPAPRRLVRRSNRERTPEQRELHGLRIAFSNRPHGSGFAPPDDVAFAIREIPSLTGAERAEAVALVRRYLAEPHVYGVPYGHAWAAPVREAYLARVMKKAAA